MSVMVLLPEIDKSGNVSHKELPEMDIILS